MTGRPPRPENLAAELRILDLAAKARRVDQELWSEARRLVDDQAITVATVARITGLSLRTAHRRLAAIRPGGSRAGEAGPAGTPEGRP